jgi:hypothetical protein
MVSIVGLDYNSHSAVGLCSFGFYEKQTLDLEAIGPIHKAELLSMDLY